MAVYTKGQEYLAAAPTYLRIVRLSHEPYGRYVGDETYNLYSGSSAYYFALSIYVDGRALL